MFEISRFHINKKNVNKSQFFCQNFRKNPDFIQNIEKIAISHNNWEVSIIFKFQEVSKLSI